MPGRGDKREDGHRARTEQAVIGGYVGGILSHRANRTAVRWTVVGIGLAVSGHYFWKLYAQSLMHIGGE